MLRTVKTLSLAAAVLMVAAGASASTLTIRLEAGNPYDGTLPAPPNPAATLVDIDVYATVADTAGMGVQSMSVNLTTPDSDGLLIPVEAWPPPNSKTAKTTWPDYIPLNFFKVAPSRLVSNAAHVGSDLDNDVDALGLAFTHTEGFGKMDVGLPETLIATLTYQLTGAGQTALVATVDTKSAYFDWGAEPPAYATPFTEVIGDSVMVGEAGANQDPIANADGPYLEGQWQYHEGGPGGRDYNFIVLDGSASDDPDGDALAFTWDLTGPDGVPWLVTGEQVTLEGNEFLAHGYVMWDTYDISLTVDDGKGGTDTATTQLQVPEPGTMLLLGLGAVGCLLRRRRA